MPITAAVTLDYEVQSVTIDGTGACAVQMHVRLGGELLKTVHAELSAAACRPVWAGIPDEPRPRWPELVSQLYALLKAQGSIPG